MNFRNLILFATLIASISFAGCTKDDPDPVSEEELITTLVYTLKQNADDPGVVLRFEDLDGDGGNAPTISSGVLAANASYAGTITLSNDSETPSEDITAEIEEEDDEHQFFFSSSLSDLAVAYSDEDGSGNPVGLRTTVTTGEAGSGTITVTLRHEPAKDAEGVSSGDIANAGGETDIEVTFNIEVQ